MITAHDLARHLDAQRRSHRDARHFAFQSPPGASLEPVARVSVDGDSIRVALAHSNLAARQALLGFERDPGEDVALAVVTPLSEPDLGQDLLARFAGRKLFAFDPWDAVAALFDAAEVDGWLRRRPGLGRALLRASSQTRFDPVTTGRLSQEDAWHRLLHTTFAVPEPCWSLASLLSWGLLHPDQLTRLAADLDLLAELRDEASERIGPSAGLLLELLTEPGRVDPARALLVVGLGARAARDASADDGLKEQSDQAFTDLSATIGVIGPARRALFAPVGDACCDVYARLAHDDPERVADVRSRLDVVLRDVGALAIASYSRTSHQGWSDRLAALGRALPAGDPDTLQRELDWVAQHDDADINPELVRRARAAAWLSFYLSSLPKPGAVTPTLSEIARDYVIKDGSFVDMMRAELVVADVGEALRPHVVDLLDRLAARRAEADASWARRLTDALSTSTRVPGTLGPHDVIPKVIVPLARDHRVLFVVLDGASWGVLRALQRDALSDSWSVLVPADADTPTPLLAALPTVTSISRTSLLTGVLQKGTQANEKKGFSSHEGLLAAIPRHREVCVFHKGELDATGVGGVGDVVHAAVTSQGQHVVGVVVNAVDDQLGGAEQIAVRWTLDAISPLRSLLELARAHDRVVVIASDHGHVLDDRSERVDAPGAVSGRHRPATMPPNPREVALTGPMARAFGASDEGLVLSVDERVRYSARHAGYHGGASIQEVVSPLVLLTPPHLESPDGFVELSDHLPSWCAWETNPATMDTSLVEPSDPELEVAPQVDLFVSPVSVAEVEPTRAPDADAASVAKRLLDSRVWASQLEHHHALKSKPGDVFRVVVALIERGGEATEDELATAITRSGSRTRRLLSSLRTALNVDGYQVLSHDPAARSVRLDRAKLHAQFELDEVAT